MRPFSLPSPAPRERSKRSWISLCKASASKSIGGNDAGQHRRMDPLVGALDRQAPGANRGADALAPALVARELTGRPCPSSMSSDSPGPDSRFVLGVGPIAAAVHLDDLVQSPEGLEQARRLARFDRFRRQRVEAACVRYDFLCGLKPEALHEGRSRCIRDLTVARPDWLSIRSQRLRTVRTVPTDRDRFGPRGSPSEVFPGCRSGADSCRMR